MAATVSRQKTLRDWPHLIREVRLSDLVGGQAEDVTHGGPANVNPAHMPYEVVTPPDTMCAFALIRDQDNDSASGGTARLKLAMEAGGDPEGLVLDVHFHFYHSASGGIS